MESYIDGQFDHNMNCLWKGYVSYLPFWYHCNAVGNQYLQYVFIKIIKKNESWSLETEVTGCEGESQDSPL